MAQHRRKFSPQFKAEAVQFVIETGRPIAEIARELESGGGTLGNWVNEWKQSNPEPEKALTPVERARVAERCALIEAEKANYPIAWMCGLLKVPRSSFYEWRSRVVSATAAVPIGTYRVPGGGSPVSTSWGTIHYSKFGAHVVPARPRPSRGRSSG